LAAEREVRIETKRRDGSVRRRIIWVVVDGGDVFVRSWKGEGGAWYRAAVRAPDELALTVGKTRIPVSAQVADDEDSVERTSRALQEKYAGDPATPSMVRPYNLATTLRLSPR
jgi:hypothetical protein